MTHTFKPVVIFVTSAALTLGIGTFTAQSAHADTKSQIENRYNACMASAAAQRSRRRQRAQRRCQRSYQNEIRALNAKTTKAGWLMQVATKAKCLGAVNSARGNKRKSALRGCLFSTVVGGLKGRNAEAIGKLNNAALQWVATKGSEIIETVIVSDLKKAFTTGKRVDWRKTARMALPRIEKSFAEKPLELGVDFIFEHACEAIARPAGTNDAPVKMLCNGLYDKFLKDPLFKQIYKRSRLARYVRKQTYRAINAARRKLESLARRAFEADPKKADPKKPERKKPELAFNASSIQNKKTRDGKGYTVGAIIMARGHKKLHFNFIFEPTPADAAKGIRRVRATTIASVSQGKPMMAKVDVTNLEMSRVVPNKKNFKAIVTVEVMDEKRKLLLRRKKALPFGDSKPYRYDGKLISVYIPDPKFYRLKPKPTEVWVVGLGQVALKTTGGFTAILKCKWAVLRNGTRSRGYTAEPKMLRPVRFTGDPAACSTKAFKLGYKGLLDAKMGPIRRIDVMWASRAKVRRSDKRIYESGVTAFMQLKPTITALGVSFKVNKWVDMTLSTGYTKTNPGCLTFPKVRTGAGMAGSLKFGSIVLTEKLLETTYSTVKLKRPWGASFKCANFLKPTSSADLRNWKKAGGS